MPNESEMYEKAIKFISNGIENFTEPENLVKWIELAKTEIDLDKTTVAVFSGQVYHIREFIVKNNLLFRITRRLDRIEDLKGYSLKEKIRLVFVFSRPVSAEFLKVLKDAKCIVKLGESKRIKDRITYLRFPDGTYLESEHTSKNKNFKGKPEKDWEITQHSPRQPDKPEVYDDGMGFLNDEEDKELMAPKEPPKKKAKMSEVVKKEERSEMEFSDGENEEIEEQNTEYLENTVDEMVSRADQEGMMVLGDLSTGEVAERPPEVTISLLRLTEQIETLAFNIDLDASFQEKLLRAVYLLKTRDETIPLQEFNLLFNNMLTNWKSDRIQNATTRNSIQLIRLFKQLRRNWIRPLGVDLMRGTLRTLDDEIRKLGESTEEILLKAVETKLDSLMHLFLDSWPDLIN